MIKIESVRRDPAERPVGIVNGEQDHGEKCRLAEVALELEPVRRAVGLTRDLGRPRLLIGPDAERKQDERAEGEKQEVDRTHRRPGHYATFRNMTSTSGFLPVHKVAQRRTARR